MNDTFIDELSVPAAIDETDGAMAYPNDADLLPDEAAMLAMIEASAEADAGQDEDGDVEAGDETGESAESRKRKKLSSSRRKSRKIAEQARQLADKDAQIAALLRELEAVSSDGGDADDAPVEDDFESPEEYERARTEHTIAHTIRGINKEERQLSAYTQLLQAQQERQRLARAQFDERLEAARPSMPDYDTKVEALLARLEAAQASMPGHVVEELHQSRNGPELLYLMAGDEGFLVHLLQSDPVSAAREIGRREALLSSSKQKLQSTAPAPRQSLKGGSAGAKDPAAMSYSDYRKWRGFDRK